MSWLGWAMQVRTVHATRLSSVVKSTYWAYEQATLYSSSSTRLETRSSDGPLGRKTRPPNLAGSCTPRLPRIYLLRDSSNVRWSAGAGANEKVKMKSLHSALHPETRHRSCPDEVHGRLRLDLGLTQRLLLLVIQIGHVSSL